MQGASGLNTLASAASRAVSGSVSVDLKRNGTYKDISDFVSLWSVDRSLTTDVPQGFRLVTGYAAAQATLTVIGSKGNDRRDTPWMWSPYNATSGTVLDGATSRIETPIRLTAGLGGTQVSSFSGYIRSIDVDAAGTATTVTCLDGSDRMRSQCNLPMIVGDYSRFTASAGQVRQGLTNARLMDYLFRANGYYTTPTPRDKCVLSVPGHGALEPEYVTDASGSYVQYGSVNSAWDGPFTDRADESEAVSYVQDIDVDARTGLPKLKFSQCPDPQKGITASWAFNGSPTFSSAAPITVEMWVDLSNPLGVSAGNQLISWTFPVVTGSTTVPFTVGFMGDRRPFIKYNNNAASFGTAPSVTGWIYALITVAPATTSLSASFMLNATVPTSGNGRVINTSATYASGSTYKIFSVQTAGCKARFEAMQITSETATAAQAASNFGFTPTAVIEPSLNNLVVVPFSSDKQDSWSVCQDLAATEFGSLFFDENGIPTFWNRNHFQFAQTTAVATATSARGLEQLTTTEAVDSVANHITVTATPYQVQPAAYVYSLGSTVGVHSRSSETFTANFDNSVIAVSTTVHYIPLGGQSGVSGYRACTNPQGTGTEVSNLTFTITPFATSATITVHNPNKFPVYLIGPSNAANGNAYPPASVGTPTFSLWGSSVIGGAASGGDNASGSGINSTTTLDVMDQDSIDLYGEQQYNVPTSNYLQDYSSLRSTANDMLAQLAHPFPTLSNVVIAAIPGLQIGDRIKLLDPDATLIANDFFVVGITTTFDPTQGYTQALTLRPLAGPGAMIWDDPVSGFWDQYVWDGTY